MPEITLYYHTNEDTAEYLLTEQDWTFVAEDLPLPDDVEPVVKFFDHAWPQQAVLYVTGDPLGPASVHWEQWLAITLPDLPEDWQTRYEDLDLPGRLPEGVRSWAIPVELVVNRPIVRHRLG